MDNAGGDLNAAAVAARGQPIAAVQYTRLPTPSTDDDDCDDLYGDFDLGFLPLPPLSPSPSSPPKTPSPGLSLPSPTPSQSPPPRRSPSPEPQLEAEPEPEPEPEPQPNPTPHHHQTPPTPTPHHQPPRRLAPNPPSPRHQPPPTPAPKALTLRLHPPQRAPAPGRPAAAPSSSAALYIGDLPWWTTDAEVEAALAPHGELRALHFFADKSSGKSRGHCRADFLSAAAAASAAAALHGRAFDGHHCVASLSRPPALHRADAADFDAAPVPNPALARAGHANNLPTAARARGNVSFSGDGSALGTMAPRPRAFGAMIGDGGGFPPVEQCGPMPASMVPPHVNPAFLAASRMAMAGTGPWHNQSMAGGFWGGPQPWNFGGCEMPWQQPGLQQQYRNGDYGKMRSAGRERPGGRNEDRDIGNVRGSSDRRQCGRGGGGRPGEHRHPEQRRRNCDDRDRRGGMKRRYQEYTERDDWQRRGRARSSQSRYSDDDDNPRQQSRDSDDDDYVIRRR